MFPQFDEMPGRIIRESPSIPAGRPASDIEFSTFSGPLAVEDFVRVLEKQAAEQIGVYGSVTIGALTRNPLTTKADWARVAEAADSGAKTMILRHRYPADDRKVKGFHKVADFARAQALGCSG